MLRWLTAGESHGPELVAILEGLPAGRGGDHGRHRRGAAPPPARLRPRCPDEVRAGRGHHRRRRAARAHPGQPGRDPHRQHRVAQVADGDGRRPGRRGAAGEPGAQRPAVASAPGPRRPVGHAEVRLRRRPPRARPGERPGDRRPGGARPGRAELPQAGARRRDRQPRGGDRRGVRARRACCPTPADAAALDEDPVRCLDPATRRGDGRRDRRRPARTATPSAA